MRERSSSRELRCVASPHLIMTYCALLALAVLRDDYAQLDRAVLARLVDTCQDADGCVHTSLPPFPPTCVFSPVRRRARRRLDHVRRFSTIPGAGDADLRMTYCAFVFYALLGDWSCIDLPRALSYIQRCRVHVSIPSFDQKVLIRNARVPHVRRWIQTSSPTRFPDSGVVSLSPYVRNYLSATFSRCVCVCENSLAALMGRPTCPPLLFSLDPWRGGLCSMGGRSARI